MRSRIYFPPVTDKPEAGKEAAKAELADESKAANAEAAEAEEVASKLPDVPKSEPGDAEHLDKKQKQ